MSKPYQLEDFDYALPEELIAQKPCACRSDARLLHVQPQQSGNCKLVDRVFRDLPSLLRPNDLLILNNTKVLAARMFAQRATGGKVEILLERILNGSSSEAVVQLKSSKKPKLGEWLYIMPKAEAGEHSSAPMLRAQFLGRWPGEEGSFFRLRFEQDIDLVMEHAGHLPLPPYIEHQADQTDEERYQTVFASQPGAVAAPTAALHFDEAVFEALNQKGIEKAYVTLHVGAGTFAPVKVQDIRAHTMHSERYYIPVATLEAIARTRAQGGRIIAVGTTTVRTLESWAVTGQTQGETSIFITPGFQFQVVQGLITNFHLPKSTLLMLVSAFAGYDTIRQSYQHAVEGRYRFFSYGDAMFLDAYPDG